VVSSILASYLKIFMALSSPSIIKTVGPVIKEDEMGRARGTNGKKAAYRLLMGTSEGKKPIGKSRRR
jgi:hypothetical protein